METKAITKYHALFFPSQSQHLTCKCMCKHTTERQGIRPLNSWIFSHMRMWKHLIAFLQKEKYFLSFAEILYVNEYRRRLSHRWDHIINLATNFTLLLYIFCIILAWLYNRRVLHSVIFPVWKMTVPVWTKPLLSAFKALTSLLMSFLFPKVHKKYNFNILWHIWSTLNTLIT